MGTALTVSLTAARLRAAGSRHRALVAALAVVTAVPALVVGFSAVTADATLVRALDELPAAERTVTVAGRPADPARLAGLGPAVSSALAPLVAGAPRAELAYRALADGAGGLMTLGAVDDLTSAVRVTSGRLPRPCSPDSCELLVVEASSGARGTPDPPTALGVTVVGRGVLTDTRLFAGTFAPSPGTTLVLGEGVAEVGRIPALELIDRAYAWAGVVDVDTVRRDGAQAWAAASTAAAGRFSLLDPSLRLTAPDAAVRAAADRAGASSGRLLLLAGGFAALLVGVVVVGAAALRPDHVRFVEALRRRGLPAAGLRVVTALESLAVTVAGTVLGALLGAALAAVLVSRAGMPLTRSVAFISGHALPGQAAMALAALALLLVVLWPTATRPAWSDERAGWRLLRFATVAGAGAVLLVAARGTAGSRADPLLTTLPALTLLTAALAAARCWPVLLRAAGGRLPRRAVGSQLGLAGSAGHPLLAAATVALLAAGTGACGFAVSYRATLERGAVDQAAHAVPTDVRLRAATGAGTAATPPLATASAADLAAAAGPQARAYPVLRAVGSTPSSGGSTGTRSDAVQLVGVPAGALAAVRDWSRVTGGPSPTGVARAVAAPDVRPGLALPAGRTLSVDVDAAPRDELAAWLRADDGRERSVVLAPARGGTRLSAALPGGRWSLTAVTVAQTYLDATHSGHATEGETARVIPSGTVELGELRVDGTVLPRPWDGWTGQGAQGLRPHAGGASATLEYRLAEGLGVVSAGGRAARPGSAERPLAVAADPRTAAAGSRLTLVVDQEPVVVRVVATLRGFPTVTGRFVVADSAALAALLDAVEPGRGQPQEVWVDGARSAAVPAAWAGFDVQSAAAYEHRLRTDPVAVGATRMLLVASVLTMLLGAAALVLLVVGQRQDDAPQLLAWETDGVALSTLRWSLWARAALVAVPAVPIGTAAGLVLTRLSARLVPLTATAQTPVPPLTSEAGPAVALLVVGVALGTALGAAAVVSLRAFREPVAQPPR